MKVVVRTISYIVHKGTWTHTQVAATVHLSGSKATGTFTFPASNEPVTKVVADRYIRELFKEGNNYESTPIQRINV